MINKNDYVDSFLNSIVGQVLKEKREQAGISLEELSKKINYKVTRQTLLYYETGRSKLKLPMFINICKALHLNPAEVYDEINMRYFKNSDFKNNQEKKED